MPVDRQPSAWMYQVRFTGEDGRPETNWRDYGVYLRQSETESGMKHAGDGLACRVVPLYMTDGQKEA